METQTITQTVDIFVGDGSLAKTGISLGLLSILSVIAVLLAIFIWYLTSRRTYRLNSRHLGLFFPVVLSALIITFYHTKTLATPSLVLESGQNNLSISVPIGGGTASTKTSITTGTTSQLGYTLLTSLSAPEQGITMSLRGGDISVDSTLTAGNPPLSLKTTSAPTTNDKTEVILTFVIDNTVTPGTKSLKFSYQIKDNIPDAPTAMQSLTSDYCQNHMDIYNGTNEDALLTLSDPRGTSRSYRVAKLADNNCWMLDNLKLGSTSSTTLLTPSDTNIATNFTLPQLVTSGVADYDNPGAYGPLPGDTGNGVTNYGYLYNWSAATAGESRVSHPANAGNAPYSICPAGWRLPSGGASGDFATLDIAFGGTGIFANSSEPNIAKWQNNGPFKGILSGYWWGGFGDQGVNGGLWSSSAYSGNVNGAYDAGIDTLSVNPSYSGGERDGGIGVRCILQ